MTARAGCAERQAAMLALSYVVFVLIVLMHGVYVCGPAQVAVKNSIDKNAWPSLYEGISIHWHGFSLKGFAWMDGTKYVAQCPITPGSSFTYKFQVRLLTVVSGVGFDKKAASSTAAFHAICISLSKSVLCCARFHQWPHTPHDLKV